MTRFLIVAALAAFSTVAPAQTVKASLSEWTIQLSRDTVKAGTVTFQVSNDGTVTHGFYVRGDGVDKGTHEIGPHEAATLTVTVKPGTYDIFCPMSEGTHRQAGMYRKLVVTPGAVPVPSRKKPQGLTR